VRSSGAARRLRRSNRALLAEVRKELAELESRIILRLNGLYIRRSECELHNALLE